MLKSAIFKKTVCITTIFSFALANLPRTAEAFGYRLTPESFEEMYALAQNGRVEALRSSINRGLNIDVMNSNGDTGLCVAARRHDSYTYNAFRAAGANPRHPCTQDIEDYDNFLANSRAVSVTSTPRAAYGTIGKEQYSVSPKIWWWIGGAALVGGAIAIALGGGGGGGGSHSSSGGGGGDTEEYNSLGSIAGTKGIIHKSVSEAAAENTSFMNITNSKVEEIASIDLNSNILQNTEYLDVALKAENSGKYTNKVDTVIQVGKGSVGMSATKKAQINNFGYINIDSYNASIGMVASEGSTATNYGQGVIPNGLPANNGISLNFSGYEDTNTLIGMYADSNSVLQNFGDIKGSAIKASSQTEEEVDTGGLVTPNPGETEVKESAATGTLVGMEAMIVNAGKDLNKDTINLLNGSAGKIYLSAGDAGATENDIKVSMIGMGSFLDDGFMNGSKNINRAENVVLRNSGEINISYTGNYTPTSDSSLRKGTGGIVGMRADARTSAYNLNNINLNLEESSSGSSSVDVAAGMQSIHGGNLSNSGNINIKTSAGNERRNYGMVSVEGSGSVSGLYADLNQNLINSGNISVQASNSFGIASYNGGNLKNSGSITLGKPETTTQYQKNIAMYGYGKTKEAILENTGVINIYSHDSIAMQNDFAGGTTIYNNGIINVFESATNSYVFGGAYSEAHNSSTINYYANSTGETASEGEEHDPFANYKLSIGNSIISTLSRSVLGEQSASSSSTTEKIYNDENSVINMDGSSFVSAMSVETDDSGETQGKAINNGEINITDSIHGNATNTVGMYLGEGAINNAYITNENSITTNSRFSAAMANASLQNASMINNGDITAKNKYSLGMYSSGISNTKNNKNIAMKGDHNAAIYSIGNTGKTLILNSPDATITVGDKNTKTEDSYGIYIGDGGKASIENSGVIDIYTKEAGAGIFSKGEDVTVSNKNTINVNGDNAAGIYATGSGKTDITNDTDGVINVGTAANNVSDSYGIYTEAKGKVSNKGTINLYNDASQKGYAIYSKNSNSEVTNEGTINLNNENGTAIYAANGKIINKETININYDSSNALEATEDVEVINETNATINVGREDQAVSNSNGMVYLAPDDTEKESDGGVLTNNGTINLYSVENGNSHAVSLNGKSVFNNNKNINSYNNYSSAVFVSDSATVNNSGNLIVKGTNVEAVKSTIASDDETQVDGLTFNNSGTITIGTSGTEGYDSYGVFAKAINSVINDGIITVHNNSSYAIYAESGNLITNNNSLTMNGKNSTAIYGGGVNLITNKGQIQINEEGGKGIISSGSGTIKNQNLITLANATDSYGIKAVSASILTDNNSSIVIGSLSADGNNGNYGIYSLEGTINNSGDIYIYGGGYGIYGQSVTSLINSGNITIENSESVGIYTSVSSVTNDGTINMSGADSIGIHSIGSSTIYNNIGAIINIVSGSAISATRYTPVINSGNITVSDTGYAINNASKLTNSGNITIEKGTAVNVRDEVTNSGSIVVNNSGTAVTVYTTGSISNTADILVKGNGTAIEGALSLSNTGEISTEAGIAVNEVRNISNNEGGIIKSSSGTAIKGASIVNNYGKIIGTDYAVDGGTELTNSTDSVISISSGTAAVNGVTTVNNSGTIEVTGTATAAILGATNVNNNGVIRINNGHGIYTTNPGTITNSGTISVSTGTGNGIYVEVPYVGSVVTITNTGNINVASGHAIYIVKNYQLNAEEVSEGERTGTKYTDGTVVEPGAMGEGAVVYGGSCGQHCKNGEIDWGGSIASASSLSSSLISVSDPSLLRNVRLLNLGQINLTGDVDFGSQEDNTSVASIGKNGTYEAESFSGTVLADNSLVEGGFDTVYVNEDAFIGEDNGLNIVSQSYLFDASLVSNENGNLNVVMTMSSFEDKVNDSRIAQYLSRNYQEQKGEGVFDILKSAGNKAQFDDYLNRELGFNIIPDLTKQSIDIERTVNNELNNDLLTDLTETNRHKVSILAYKNEVDDKKEVSGYKDVVISAYGYSDKALNNKLRAGLSLAVTRSESDFNDDSSRYNNMLEVGAPIIFNNDFISALIKPKAGFARGHYRRNAVNKAYKANTKEYYYGFDSDLRHNFDLGYIALEPNAGFNFIGLYTDDIKENKDGLKIKSNNTLSSLITLGMDIKKKFILDNHNSLSFIAGGKYYHELGDKYRNDATISDMNGYYDIVSNRFQRDFGLINLRAVYDYRQLSVGASANIPLEQKRQPYYLLNLGYKF